MPRQGAQGARPAAGGGRSGLTIQPELVAANGRRFAGFAAAVFVFIVDPATRRILLLSSPSKRGRPGWEIVNGGLKAGESLLDGAIREVAEETGTDLRMDVVATVHAWTYHYDDAVPHMISVAFAGAYLGGDVVPGDDMAGSDVRWATLDEIRTLSADDHTALIPEDVSLFQRAIDAVERWHR